MADIEIISAGLLTTVQDLGRHGYRAFGVPVSGAMDKEAFQLAKEIVGNGPQAAGLEMTLLGPRIRFNKSTFIALCGAHIPAMINNQLIPYFKRILVYAGDELSFSSFQQGCRAYLAFAGGIDVPEVLGSRSTYLRGKIGGLDGRQLQAGDQLRLLPFQKTKQKSLKTGQHPLLRNPNAIRVFAGPEINAFTAQSVNLFLSSSYAVSNESDRMGYRLTGPKLFHKQEADILSSALTEGSIQVTGQGQAIIMMVDHQTTGGYTRIAQVVSADISLLAQMKPGDQINFIETTFR